MASSSLIVPIMHWKNLTSQSIMGQLYIFRVISDITLCKCDLHRVLQNSTFMLLWDWMYKQVAILCQFFITILSTHLNYACTHTYITRILNFVKMTVDCGINHERTKYIKYTKLLQCKILQYFMSTYTVLWIILTHKKIIYRVEKLCTEVCS